MESRTFEEKLAYSKELLDRLMSPDVTLEESLKLYQDGLANIKEAQKMLEDAKAKISYIERENQELKLDNE
jgi:exodeoxyribonuclease VII small subunit